MTNSKTILTDLIQALTLNIALDEKQAIGSLVMEKIFAIDRMDILTNKPVPFTVIQQQKLNTIINRINANEPVQYVLEEAWFSGRPFYVNTKVLIPRPETEELVQHVLNHDPLQRVLDIGTGSGCIAVTVKLERPAAQVHAIDISDAALAVAKINADALGADVTFQQLDILNDAIPFQAVDVVVSNPPYVLRQEQAAMEKHVVDFEPHLALFVSDNDPLLFYRIIAEKSKAVLSDRGILLVEINARYGAAVAALFATLGYQDVLVLQDINGKDRMVKAMHYSL